MKKLLTLALVATLSFGALATFSSCKKATPVVGLITLHNESSTYDKNFIDAFKTACKNKGLKNGEYQIVTDKAESNECYEAAADLVDSGCKAVFADSFGHEGYMIKAAKEFTDVQFFHATGTQATNNPPANYHNAFASIYEGRYLAGYAAGLKLNTMKDKAVSNKFKVGYVGAWTYAEVISGYTSWFLGLEAALDEGYTAEMLVQFTGSWYDETAEKSAAENLIGKGCVLISQHADSMGAPTACETAGVPNVSYNGSTGKNTLVAYSKINWVPYFEKMIDCAVNGTTVEKDWCGTLDTSSVQWALGTNVAEGTKAAVEAVEAELKAGTRKVFDCSKFTVTVIPGDTGKNQTATVDENGHLTAYIADVIDVGDFAKETNVIKTAGGVTYFDESAANFRSAPYFDLTIDGVTLLNAVYETNEDGTPNIIDFGA